MDLETVGPRLLYTFRDLTAAHLPKVRVLCQEQLFPGMPSGYIEHYMGMNRAALGDANSRSLLVGVFEVDSDALVAYVCTWYQPAMVCTAAELEEEAAHRARQQWGPVNPTMYEAQLGSFLRTALRRTEGQPDDDAVFISQIAVHSDHRRRGIGKALLQLVRQRAVMEGARLMWLLCPTMWKAEAHALYLSEGLQHVAIEGRDFFVSPIRAPPAEYWSSATTGRAVPTAASPTPKDPKTLAIPSYSAIGVRASGTWTSPLPPPSLGVRGAGLRVGEGAGRRSGGTITTACAGLELAAAAAQVGAAAGRQVDAVAGTLHLPPLHCATPVQQDRIRTRWGCPRWLV